METTQASGISGGIGTIFVTDMERAIKFYTEKLGFTLTYQAGEHWASIDAGNGFQIGLHPRGDKGPQPGVQGAVQLGFNVTRPIEDIVSGLEANGVAFPKGIHDDGGVKLAFFQDPDGNEHYLCQVMH